MSGPGTVYASRVEGSGDVVHAGTLFRHEMFAGTTLDAHKAHFVHDGASGEVSQSSSIHHKSDAAGPAGPTTGTLHLRVRDSALVSSRVQATPGSTRIGGDREGAATLDVKGLRFNSDSAGLHFGENQEFRIVMTQEAPPRLRFQGFDAARGEYVTKFSVAN